MSLNRQRLQHVPTALRKFFSHHSRDSAVNPLLRGHTAGLAWSKQTQLWTDSVSVFLVFNSLYLPDWPSLVLLPVGRVRIPQHCPPGPQAVLWTHREGFSRWKQISVHRGIPSPPFPRRQKKQSSTMLFITVFYSTEQEQHISAQVILEILNNLEGDKYSVRTKQRGPSRAGEHLEKQRQKRRNEYSEVGFTNQEWSTCME